MLNAIGLQNIGARAFVETKLPLLKRYDTRVIANVFGYSDEDYVEAITILNDGEGIAAYELNISCPNVKEGGIVIGNSASAAARLTEKAKRAASRPLIVKLSPNVTDISLVARAIAEAGADSLSLINTIVGMAIDVKTRRPRLNYGTGGLSGAAIRPIAVRMVYEAANSVSVPIIGIGGISTAMDALEFIIAGAAAVQIGTANYYDPRVTMKVIDGLSDYATARAQKVYLPFPAQFLNPNPRADAAPLRPCSHSFMVFVEKKISFPQSPHQALRTYPDPSVRPKACLPKDRARGLALSDNLH